MTMRLLLLALSLLAAPLAAAPAKVTGFSYVWPKTLEKTPALVAYLKKDRAAQYKDYAPLFNEPPEAGPPLDSYENGTNWTVQTTLPGLLILTGQRWAYTGGAHGYGIERVFNQPCAPGIAGQWRAAGDDAVAIAPLMG